MAIHVEKENFTPSSHYAGDKVPIAPKSPRDMAYGRSCVIILNHTKQSAL